jgi:hypothetical protein
MRQLFHKWSKRVARIVVQIDMAYISRHEHKRNVAVAQDPVRNVYVSIACIAHPPASHVNHRGTTEVRELQISLIRPNRRQRYPPQRHRAHTRKAICHVHRMGRRSARHSPGHVLQRPWISVGVGKVGVQNAAPDIFDLADVHTSPKQIVAGRVNVGDYQMQPR